MNVLIKPQINTEDKGDGGIRRVIEAQIKYLPEYGINIVDTLDEADIIAVHAGEWVETNKPVVSHCHGLYWSEYKWPEWADKLNKHVIESIRKADAVTAPCEWVANAIRRGFCINPSIIPHGVDCNYWTPGKPGGYVLWNKTRVDPVCTVDSLAYLIDNNPDIVFVSTAPVKGAKIIDVTSVNEHRPYVQNASVYLGTTRETFGIGLLEALACGVPILGWDWGGLKEIITHKVHGYLARPGDFESLNNGLKWIIENRDKLSPNCRELAKKYTWESAIKKYAELYKSLSKPSIKVSVIIPCYNLAKYLPDAIESVINQSYKNLEVVVVDDASPDNTTDIALSYSKRDPRVRVLKNKKNKYLAEALNIGISKAKGEYILPLDADNMLAPDSLETLVNALDNNRAIDIVYGSMKVIEEDGTTSVSKWPPSVFNFAHQMSHRNQITSTALYRKKIWERVGGYRARCRTAEDADFWCRATSFGAKPEKVTEDVVLIYRNRHDSMSHVQPDWAWNQWYYWHADVRTAPAAAPIDKPNVWSYEPAYIAVIIPVGPGHERLVLDAVDSLLSQDFVRWECIVVNDTGDKLPWIHPFCKVIDTPGKVGPAKARNLGIKASTAPLFIPLDADDYLQPHALRRFYEVWQQYGGYVYSDWYEQETKVRHHSPDFDPHEVLRHLPHAVTALYSKKAWEEVGGFDETLDSWEDWDFIIALNAAGYCGVRIPEPLFLYRYTAGSRREELYARREQCKEVIKNKWHEYMTGGKSLMSCSGCQKGGTTQAIRSTRTSPTEPTPSGYVKIEYVGTSEGAITYRGHYTGKLYRFGRDPGHRYHNVHEKDAPLLLNRKEFRTAVNPEAALDAFTHITS